MLFMFSIACSSFEDGEFLHGKMQGRMEAVIHYISPSSSPLDYI